MTFGIALQVAVAFYGRRLLSILTDYRYGIKLLAVDTISQEIFSDIMHIMTLSKYLLPMDIAVCYCICIP